MTRIIAGGWLGRGKITAVHLSGRTRTVARTIGPHETLNYIAHFATLNVYHPLLNHPQLESPPAMAP